MVPINSGVLEHGPWSPTLSQFKIRSRLQLELYLPCDSNKWIAVIQRHRARVG
jgi:hypothetical protein